jgi:hypothetical protein
VGLCHLRLLEHLVVRLQHGVHRADLFLLLSHREQRLGLGDLEVELRHVVLAVIFVVALLVRFGIGVHRM